MGPVHKFVHTEKKCGPQGCGEHKGRSWPICCTPNQSLPLQIPYPIHQKPHTHPLMVQRNQGRCQQQVGALLAALMPLRGRGR